MAKTMMAMVTLGKVLAAVGTAVKVAAAAATAKLVPDPPKAPDMPDFSNMTSLMNANLESTKYKYAPTQDVNIGYQNYLTDLKRVAPYYVSRYSPNLKRNYVETINKKEAQAALDQPDIHKYRLPKAKLQIAETRRRANEKEEKLPEE
jgi:hypothetical protein